MSDIIEIQDEQQEYNPNGTLPQKRPEPDSAPDDTPMEKKSKIDKDDFNCPVCLNCMFSAMLTSCGHPICQECIPSINGTCPTCRKRTLAPVPNYGLRSVIAQLSDPEELKTYELKCAIKTPRGLAKVLSDTGATVKGEGDSLTIFTALKFVHEIIQDKHFSVDLHNVWNHKSAYTYIEYHTLNHHVHITAKHWVKVSRGEDMYILMTNDRLPTPPGKKRINVHITL